MFVASLLWCAPLLLLLIIAAVGDMHTRRIPNWLTLGLALSGIAQSLFHGVNSPIQVGPKEAALGLLVGFSLPFILFVLSAVGGADVKLLAGVGAWLGPSLTFRVFLVEAVLGMLIVLYQAGRQGRLRTLLRNSTVVAINLAHVNEVGLDHVTQTGKNSRSVDRPLPYAVPVLGAVIIVLGLIWMGDRL